jgi:hypothetical protein
MNSDKYLVALSSTDEKFDDIKDPRAKEIILNLLNIVEEFNLENVNLKKENRNLKDEINKLKGEQGNPTIKGNSNKDTNVSSEKERKKAEDSQNSAPECRTPI